MINSTEQDLYWLQQALLLAQYAESMGEVPVGAILVLDNHMIGQGWNQPITRNDPTAHAEIIALRAGAHSIDNYRLLNATLYTTLEPCSMCAGAIIHSRIKRLVFSALDAKAGAVGSVVNILELKQLNHRIAYESGLLADESSELLKRFFKGKRK